MLQLHRLQSLRIVVAKQSRIVGVLRALHIPHQSALQLLLIMFLFMLLASFSVKQASGLRRG